MSNELRFKIFSLCLIISPFVLLSRLFYWQIVKGKELSEQADNQHKTGFVLNAKRGDILASDGSILVSTANAWLLFANPKKITDEKNVARKIADIVEQDKEKKDAEEERILKLIKRKDLSWVAIKQKVERIEKEKIENLGLEGLGFETGSQRTYSEGSSSAQLLGFVGKDNDGKDYGYFGLEGFYQISLSPKSGFVSRDADPLGVPILTGDAKEISAMEGVSLKTHIDKAIQLSLDRNLLLGMEKYGAKAANAIVMDPKTGAILGMSSYPNYDPSNYSEFDNSLYSNPAVSQTFEPGSIFKVLVMSAGLDSEVIKPDSICDICDGPVTVDKYQIGTWNDKYYPDSTMTDVIVHSDNVGMVFVGRKVGQERLYDYLDKFGIGNRTGVDLQGEATGKLRERGNWSSVDLATTTFGQGIAVTPIQMIKAVGAIANGGIPMTPQIVDKLIGSGWEEEIKPKQLERVISEKAARDMALMMVEAAKNGESKWTYLKGFKVAGKTGTAQVPIAGHYDEDKTIASFVGFAPFDNPKFVMLVTLNEPETSQWASETAAPLWYSIARDLFLFMGIQPER